MLVLMLIWGFFGGLGSVEVFAAPHQTTRKITLEWSRLEHAHSYEIEIAFQPEFERRLFRKKTKTLKVRTWLFPGTYYYRVRGLDENQHPGPWSPVQGFIVNSFPPHLGEPGEGAVYVVHPDSQSLIFSWTENRKKSKGFVQSPYVIEIREDNAAKKLLVRERIQNTEYAWKPTRTGFYLWRVGFEEVGGEEWSPYRKVQIQNPDETVVLAESLDPPPPEPRQEIRDVSTALLRAVSLHIGIGSSFERLEDTDGALRKSVVNPLIQTRLDLRGEFPRGVEVDGSIGFLRRSFDDQTRTLPQSTWRFSLVGNPWSQDRAFLLGPTLHLSARREGFERAGRSIEFGRFQVGAGLSLIWKISERFQGRILALLRNDWGGSPKVLPHALDSALGWEFSGVGLYDFNSGLFIETQLVVEHQKYAWEPLLPGGKSSQVIQTDGMGSLGLGYRF